MVSDIDELVDDCKRTISSISLEKVGRFDDLDSGVQLTCYRIVQEALSNVLRHAPGSESKVCLSREAGAVRVRVVNTLGNARPASDGQNLGIVECANARRSWVVNWTPDRIRKVSGLCRHWCR
ncbi:hypothetical protein ACETU7_29265 [Rhodococcus sp. 3Y1]